MRITSITFLLILLTSLALHADPKKGDGIVVRLSTIPSVAVIAEENGDVKVRVQGDIAEKACSAAAKEEQLNFEKLSCLCKAQEKACSVTIGNGGSLAGLQENDSKNSMATLVQALQITPLPLHADPKKGGEIMVRQSKIPSVSVLADEEGDVKVRVEGDIARMACSAAAEERPQFENLFCLCEAQVRACWVTIGNGGSLDGLFGIYSKNSMATLVRALQR